MRRMSPNQSGTTPADNDDDSRTAATVVVTGDKPTRRISSEKEDGFDPMLTTDCSSRVSPLMQKQQQQHLHGIGLKDPRITSLQSQPTRKEKVPIDNMNIGATKGNSEEEDNFEENDDDDRSSVVTESSQSDWEDQKEGRFNEALRLKADSLAVDAINCASDELQGNKRGVISVRSELNAIREARGVAPELSPWGNSGSAVGRANNGYVMSEVGLPSRGRQRDAKMTNGKELALNGTNNQVAVPPSASQSQSLAHTITSPGAGQPQTTTAIFNDSTDITVGNKTFITGSLTIKQYIKDSGSSNLANNEADSYTWKKFSTRKKVALISVAILITTGFIAAAIVFSLLPNGQSNRIGDGDDSRYNIPIKSSIERDQTSTGSVLRLIPRPTWIAQPPNSPATELELPVNRIIIAHTATGNCTTQSSCIFQVRQIQTYHMESLNWDDIGYNFLVGGDGAAYEGRGWDSQGAHTKGYNKGSICIAFIGTFTKFAPPERQLNAAKLLMEEGVRLKKLDKDYKLYGHRQFYATESPGNALQEIITKWDHWANDVV